MDMVDPDIATGIRETFSFIVMFIVVLPIIGLIGGEGLTKGWEIFEVLSRRTPAFCSCKGLSGGLSYLPGTGIKYNGCGCMAFNVTYALWSIPFGWLLALAQGAPYTVTGTAIIGAVIITTGTILVVANPKELLKLRN